MINYLDMYLSLKTTLARVISQDSLSDQIFSCAMWPTDKRDMKYRSNNLASLIDRVLVQHPINTLGLPTITLLSLVKSQAYYYKSGEYTYRATARDLLTNKYHEDALCKVLCLHYQGNGHYTIAEKASQTVDLILVFTEGVRARYDLKILWSASFVYKYAILNKYTFEGYPFEGMFENSPSVFYELEECSEGVISVDETGIETKIPGSQFLLDDFTMQPVMAIVKEHGANDVKELSTSDMLYGTPYYGADGQQKAFDISQIDLVVKPQEQADGTLVYPYAVLDIDFRVIQSTSVSLIERGHIYLTHDTQISLSEDKTEIAFSAKGSFSSFNYLRILLNCENYIGENFAPLYYEGEAGESKGGSGVKGINIRSALKFLENNTNESICIVLPLGKNDALSGHAIELGGFSAGDLYRSETTDDQKKEYQNFISSVVPEGLRFNDGENELLRSFNWRSFAVANTQRYYIALRKEWIIPLHVAGVTVGAQSLIFTVETRARTYPSIESVLGADISIGNKVAELARRKINERAGKKATETTYTFNIQDEAHRLFAIPYSDLSQELFIKVLRACCFLEELTLDDINILTDLVADAYERFNTFSDEPDFEKNPFAATDIKYESLLTPSVMNKLDTDKSMRSYLLSVTKKIVTSDGDGATAGSDSFNEQKTYIRNLLGDID